jgi:hypothetical protein
MCFKKQFLRKESFSEVTKIRKRKKEKKAGNFVYEVRMFLNNAKIVREKKH